jgi:hypothetical protein
MTVEAVRKMLFGVSLILAASLALAQDAQPAAQNQTQGWRRIGDAAPAATPAPAQEPAPAPGRDPEPIARDTAEAQPQAPAAQPQSAMPAVSNPPDQPPPYGLPAVLTIKPGTFLTIRVNEPLSSDRNRPGDSFSGTLAQPLVVDGVVAAQRGQMVYGTVVEAAKAHADTPSRLGLALSEITLADGAQMPVRSQLAAFQGGHTPASEQAGTIVGTTAIGATVGAMAGWGTGAAIGSGVGALAGGIAVLLTRNRPTVIYPESALTFRTEAPLEISTARAPQAFRFVNPDDYNRPQQLEARAPRPGPVLRRNYYPPYPYWGWGYPYPYYYPYYGPGFGVFIGRGRRWR